jgi:anaerobic C4-dicarboxylate transporter
MNTPLSSVLIYLLGFVGLASVGLLPLRSWHVLRSIFRSNPTHAPRKVLVAFAVLLVAVGLWSDVQITARIFRCLTKTYCGPSVASGWTYLAILGVVYLAFEAVILGMQKVGRAKPVRPAM